jgi:hypothetical protein
MGIPLEEGREFSWVADRPGGHRVAIVNQAFARAYLRGRRAVGTPLDIRWVSELNPAGSQWEIVGVAGDTHQANLDREPVPEIFLSMSQIGAEGAGYVIRARRDDAGLPAAIAGAVAAQDPRIQRVNVEPLALLVERNLAGRDTAQKLAGGFGALALLLTAIGIYGVAAFRAAERSREMAIRSALGATAAQLRGLVLSYGARLTAVGIVIGLGGFACAMPLLRRELYGIAPMDLPSIAGVAVGVLAVAVLASWGPSRRAGRSEPMELLPER